jgi:hypothetical protein
MVVFNEYKTLLIEVRVCIVTIEMVMDRDNQNQNISSTIKLV